MNEADSWRCCRLNLAGSRAATMTGRNLRNITSGVDSLQFSANFISYVSLFFREHVSALVSNREDEREFYRTCLALLRFVFCSS